MLMSSRRGSNLVKWEVLLDTVSLVSIVACIKSRMIGKSIHANVLLQSIVVWIEKILSVLYSV